MAMTGGNLFVDTNVLLRATHSGFSLHREAAAYLAQHQQNEGELWISRQVIREYLVQVTRPGLLPHLLTGPEAAGAVDLLQSLFRIADDDAHVTERLLYLMRNYAVGGKQVHDANIVATMLAFGIERLVTTNYADMKRFSDLIEVIHLQPEQ